MKFLKDLFKKDNNKDLTVREDLINDKAFFSDKQGSLNNEIEYLYNLAKKENVIPNTYNALIDSLLKLVICKYSKGDNVLDLHKISEDLLKYTPKLWNNNIDYSSGGDINYGKLLDIISIGILMKLDQSNFDNLAKVIINKNYPDFVIHSLINTQSSILRPKDEDLLMNNEATSTLRSIILTKNKKDAEKKLKFYLDNLFYTEERLGYYFESHLRNDAMAYYGYWAWEVGAIVMLKDLNDSSFKNHKFYPYDMLNWENPYELKDPNFLY